MKIFKRKAILPKPTRPYQNRAGGIHIQGSDVRPTKPPPKPKDCNRSRK